MRKFLSIAILIFIGGNLADLFSTLPYSPDNEMNPLMRYFWETFDVYGLIFLSTFLGVFILSLSLVSYKYTRHPVFPVIIMTIGLYKIILGLANTAIISLPSWLLVF